MYTISLEATCIYRTSGSGEARDSRRTKPYIGDKEPIPTTLSFRVRDDSDEWRYGNFVVSLCRFILVGRNFDL